MLPSQISGFYAQLTTVRRKSRRRSVSRRPYKSVCCCGAPIMDQNIPSRHAINAGSTLFRALKPAWLASGTGHVSGSAKISANPKRTQQL